MKKYKKTLKTFYICELETD